jgi:hypothetical protein
MRQGVFLIISLRKLSAGKDLGMLMSAERDGNVTVVA